MLKPLSSNAEQFIFQVTFGYDVQLIQNFSSLLHFPNGSHAPDLLHN